MLLCSASRIAPLSTPKAIARPKKQVMAICCRRKRLDARMTVSVVFNDDQYNAAVDFELPAGEYPYWRKLQ